MLYVVSLTNQHRYARQLDQMFDARPGQTTDSHDDEAAVYLLSLDQLGNVGASARLNPDADGGWRLSRWAVMRAAANHEGDLFDGVAAFCRMRGLSRLALADGSRATERLAVIGHALRVMGADDVVIEIDPETVG